MALPGMAVPFGIAAGLAKLLYDVETDGSVQFSTFYLFVGTTMAVTSLSVLSRVLAELRLLSTTLGSVAIAAGACNDTIGVSGAQRLCMHEAHAAQYILLALASALAGGGKQINALFQVRPAECSRSAALTLRSCSSAWRWRSSCGSSCGRWCSCGFDTRRLTCRARRTGRTIACRRGCSCLCWSDRWRLAVSAARNLAA